MPFRESLELREVVQHLETVAVELHPKDRAVGVDAPSSGRSVEDSARTFHESGRDFRTVEAGE